jgi:hypothetical protein
MSEEIWSVEQLSIAILSQLQHFVNLKAYEKYVLNKQPILMFKIFGLRIFRAFLSRRSSACTLHNSESVFFNTFFEDVIT